MTEDARNDEVMTIVVGDAPAEAAPRTAVQQPEATTTWPIDEVCAAAVSVARQAILEEADTALVGEHAGMVGEGPMVVTHFFEGHVPGYQGWRWSVTISRAPDSDQVSVDETALLPDGDALLAPAWVPWKQRIESGDLGPGDVLVTDPDDPRLIPGMAQDDVPEPSDDLLPAAWERGLGRVRILSPQGRRQAAQRWYQEVGPRAAAARATELECSTCGFFMLIGGPLGQAFGVCANEYSAFDGRVVALDFGCGAHSETQEVPSVAVAETVIDEVAFDDLAAVPEPDSSDDLSSDDPGQAQSADDVAAATDAGPSDSPGPAGSDSSEAEVADPDPQSLDAAQTGPDHAVVPETAPDDATMQEQVPKEDT
jgi:hypothetical protein